VRKLASGQRRRGGSCKGGDGADIGAQLRAYPAQGQALEPARAADPCIVAGMALANAP
jgi:hypothetical protein